MALKLTVESFLQVVRQSGLIDKDQLAKLLQAYEARGVDVKKSQTIADALIADDVITRWQAEKLLAGKHKGFTLGKYKLLGLLGKGGMSSVYLAEHLLMKRRCAIKVLPSKRVNDSSYLARFHREAQAVASVDHPNIVRAYDVDHAQDRDSQIHFLVMEYVNGQSLHELIIRSGPADFADAMEYIRQAAEGLDHAHRAGLVHRDIKPANLLIDTNGTIKLLDMGLARFFDDQSENSLTVAHDEKVLGTADYLAPEQALDSHTVDIRADIYSLGCSLYFLLTGNPPFTEGTLTQRLMWHQTKSFPPLTNSRIDCPASLSAVLEKMVQKKPDDRYQTAADVAEACRQWLLENAGEDWKQRHVPLGRGSGSARVTMPSRDLPSDPAILEGAPPVIGSTVIPLESGGSSATKISRAGSGPATPVIKPATIVSTPVIPPMAAPVFVPPVVAPLVAAPVVPPLAQPVIVAPPVARLVLPVAMPVAAPVIATPVAQSIKVAAPVALPVKPATAPAVVTEDRPAEIPEFQFGNFAATDETVIAPAETPAESAEEDNPFAFFSAGSDESSVKEEQPNSPALFEEAATMEPPLPEAVVIESSELPSSTEELSFEPIQTETDAATSPSVSKKSPASGSSMLKKPAAKYAALAAAVVILIGGIAWWTMGGSNDSDKSVTKFGKKEKGRKSPESDSVDSAAKSDAYEVVLHVGAGLDFKSIERALYSAVEGRAEYEKAAKGKPIRFVVSVKPDQSFEEAIVVDESFPGELHLKSDTPGKNVKLTPPSAAEPAITIKNLSGVTIENFHIELNAFPPKDKAISVHGSATRCRVKNCLINSPRVAGIELVGVKGGLEADAIVIESVTIQNAAPTAFGVHVAKPTDSAATQNVIVQRCRFIGSMSAGVFIDGPADSLTIRNCGMSGTTSGIRFSEGVVAKSVVVDHCSFRNQTESGLLFDAMPGAGAGEFAWRNCLFAGAAKAELLIAKDYDANTFIALMSANESVENNWSDRKVGNPVIGERDLLSNDSRVPPPIKFESTGSNSELYLVPKAGEPYKSAGIKPK